MSFIYINSYNNIVARYMLEKNIFQIRFTLKQTLINDVFFYLSESGKRKSFLRKGNKNRNLLQLRSSLWFLHLLSALHLLIERETEREVAWRIVCPAPTSHASRINLGLPRLFWLPVTAALSETSSRFSRIFTSPHSS